MVTSFLRLCLPRTGLRVCSGDCVVIMTTSVAAAEAAILTEPTIGQGDRMKHTGRQNETYGKIG